MMMVLMLPQAELFNPRCLFLFGTYTIGKERLFMHVATALQRKASSDTRLWCAHGGRIWG
jgi:DNA cross-link repair 1A protein